MAAKLMKKAGFESIELFKDQIIGIGAFGAVYHAQCDDLPCAAKILDPTIFSMAGLYKNAQRFEQECKFIRTVQHPNIVQYLGVHYDDVTGQPVLLMEMMDENLTHFLESSPDKVPYHLQVNFCRDIVLALSYLHSNGIIHRNLSGNNVLLISNIRAKVSDFGMARLSSFDPKRSFLAHTMSSTTLPYMPPEGLRNNPNYDVKIDCFSFGVVAIQIMTRKFPSPTDHHKPPDAEYADCMQSQSYVNIPEIERRKGHISEIDPNHPLLQIALPCLSNDSTHRPSAQKLYKKMKKLQESDKYCKSVSDSGASSKGARNEKSSNELEGNQPTSGKDADTSGPNQEQTISNTMKASNSHIPEEYHDGPIDGAEDSEPQDVVIVAAELHAKEDELESKRDNVSITQQENKQDGTDEPEQESRDDIIQKPKPKTKQDGTEESELESKCDDVSVTQQSEQESKREESEIESKQDGTDESEVESKHDNAESQRQESKRDDARPDQESKQKAKEGKEVQTHGTGMANDSPEITILSADSPTKSESSPKGDLEASDSYVAEEKVEESHDDPIDGAEDPETQDVIIISAEVHTKEDETSPEQNSPNNKANLSDQHLSNYQDYEQKSLKVSGFDKEEEILGESTPKSQGIKPADSSRSTDKGELIVIPSPSSIDKNGDQSCKSMHEIEELIEDEEISKPVEDENTESHRDSPQHENGAEVKLRSKEENGHIVQTAVTTDVKREESEDTVQDSGHEDVQQEMQGSGDDMMNKKEERKPVQKVDTDLEDTPQEIKHSATEQLKEERKQCGDLIITQQPKQDGKEESEIESKQDGMDEAEVESKHDNAGPQRQESKRDDVQPDQESKQKVKEGEEVQTHSDTTMANNSPEITADSDEGATSSSKGEKSVHGGPIDGTEDPEIQDVITIAAEVHTMEDQTLPEQNTSSEKAKASDQHPSNHQDYKHKLQRAGGFDQDEVTATGESLPKSEDTKSGKSNKVEIEKVQDDARSKEGKESQIRSGAETVNDSPEITVSLQATGSDEGATKPEGR